MGINRHKNHLVVFMEDRPYRDIVNGAKSLLNVNENIVDSKEPSGGWSKTFEKLKENLQLIGKFKNMHVLVLIDFDNEYEKRYDIFENILKDNNCLDRAFLLGIDAKESEDLKKALGYKNSEDIAKILLENCPDETANEWENRHLKSNLREIERMRDGGVFQWLFIK